MKLKVHAQRKFAQGAFIPPSVTSSAGERRVDITPSKDENKNVYYNRMSAVNLLDIVAFQNMHSHTEPVVLLERLEEIQESLGLPPPGLNGSITNPVKTTTSNGIPNHNKTKPVTPFRYTRAKRTGGLNPRAQRPQSIHMRPRLSSTFKPNTRVVKKKCREKPRVGPPALRRRRLPSPAESYDMDDDKPLTYIAQVLRRTVALRSDRSLRKRRGDELPSTSKRRARVPIPARPQKVPKPSVPAATLKVAQAGTDSDEDTDHETANRPTKLKQSNAAKASSTNACNGFKVNEGAGTSKQAPTTRKDAGNKSHLADGGRMNAPSRSVATNDSSANAQPPPRTTSRARTMTKSMLEYHKMNLKPRLKTQNGDTRSVRGRRVIQNKNSTKTGSILPQIIIPRINDEPPAVSPTHTTIEHNGNIPSTAQAPANANGNLENCVKGQLHQNGHDDMPGTSRDVDSVSRAQPTTQNGNTIDTQSPSTSQSDYNPKSTTQSQKCKVNDHNLRSSHRGHPPPQNDHELKTGARLKDINSKKTTSTIQSSDQSSTSDQSTNHKGVVKNSTQPQQISQHPVTDHNLSGPRSQAPAQKPLELRVVLKPHPINQNNDCALGESSQMQSPNASTDLNRISSTQATSTTDNSHRLRSNVRAQPTIEINNLAITSGPRLQPNPLPTQPLILSSTFGLRSNTSQPIIILKDQRVLPMSQSNNQDVGPQLIHNAIASTSRMIPDDLNLPSTSRGLPGRQNNDIEFNNPRVLLTTLNVQNNMQIPSTVQNTNIDVGGVPQDASSSQSNPGGNSQSQPTQSNDVDMSSPQAQTGQGNDDGGNPQNQTEAQIRARRLAARVRPTINNSHIGRIIFQNNDFDLTRNVRARVVLPSTDIDLRVNARPLSAIHNYDWNFGASRNRNSFQSNFHGLRASHTPQPIPRNAAQRPTYSDLPIRNDLGLRTDQRTLLTPVRNVDAERAANSRPQVQNNEVQTASTAQPTVPNDQPSSGRGIYRDDVPFRSLHRARPTIRNVNVGGNSRSGRGGGLMRPSFRGDSVHRVRSALLNDEIGARPRQRLAHNDLDLRVPLQTVRDQARHWNVETNGPERVRDQQARAETLAAANRAARAERLAAAAAERERAITLDEALRECVMTAQAVTTVELTRTQRRQGIAARQQQLAEGSSLLRRNATRQTSGTVETPHTEVNGVHRATERDGALSPPQAEEPEPEPGPSKVPRRRLALSPTGPGPSGLSRTRSSDRDSEPRQEPSDADTGRSLLRTKKPTSTEVFSEPTTSSGSRDRESGSQPQPESESEPVPAKSRKKQLSSSPGDSESHPRSPDREADPQPGPSKLRRKRTLLGEMWRKSRQRTPERQFDPTPGKSYIGEFRDRSPTGTKSLNRTLEPKETNSEVRKDKTDAAKDTTDAAKNTTDSAKDATDVAAVPTSSRHPSCVVEPATEQGDIETPMDRIARCSTARRPIVENWLKDVISGHSDEDRSHFKVPRIPVAKKSTERRAGKPQDQDNAQNGSTPESNASTAEDNEETGYHSIVLPEKEPPFPCRETLAEPIIQPKNACLCKHYTTVRSIVHATESELSQRCGYCIFCIRVDKIRKLSNLVQDQRKPAATNNEVYDFDADKEDSHENTRLFNFRQNRKAKLIEPATKQDNPKDPVYLDVLPPQNPHIIEITSVQMPNQNKPMLRARLIRKTDANLENEFSLIEHENLLDQLLEIKISNTDQAAKRSAPVEADEAVAGPSNVEPVLSEPIEIIDSADELNYETDDSTEFLARLQTKLNTRRRSGQTNLRAERLSLLKKRAEAKKNELAKKAKSLRKSNDQTMHVDVPKNYISDTFSRCFREAPVFYPTEEEFIDPLAYFDKIYPLAAQYGLCKVVAPCGFRPKCTITDDVRFNVANQYISRLYCRWGTASKEMCAIKAYLAEQKVFFTRPPLIEGIELNLPKLYRTVQRYGGLKKVIEKKRWGRVAEAMRFPRGPRSAKRIDQLYVKHLLPYDTLSSNERRELMNTVENSWNRNYKKMLNRASNPLHRQKKLMGESESSDEVDTDEDANLVYALAEAEDCVVTGRCMKLSVFKKVATNLMGTLFPKTMQPNAGDVEKEYWALVSGATEHVCVNSASIDTGEEGYGFPRAKYDHYSKHPWNLKMFSQNSGNVLRSLGPVLGVTVPTLHLGMVFSTSCWHRDPHGLPWVEYMHHGPSKIWYGIPDELSTDFRKAVETLCPTSCQNKSIWLPSDITMIPPPLLHAARVPLSRTAQRPGEFVVVCPKAYSSSIATGYTESESVYFAPTQWLDDVSDVFQELRDSCEPTMFSLSQLLLAVASDARTPLHVLAGVSANLREIVAAELAQRDALEKCGVELIAPEQCRASCTQARKRPAGAWNVREQDECEICRTTLYLSKVTGLTSKRSSLCLEHALLLIEKEKKRNTDVTNVIVATIFVLRSELEDAVDRVEERLRAN